MNIMRGVLVGLYTFLACLCLLFFAYPWSIYYGNFDYGWGITISSYLLLSIIVGMMEAVLVCVLSSYGHIPPTGQCILTSVLSLAMLSLGSIILGPGGVDVFHTRIPGIFFSEWKFATFDFEIALPISIMDAVLVWWYLRRDQRAGGPR